MAKKKTQSEGEAPAEAPQQDGTPAASDGLPSGEPKPHRPAFTVGPIATSKDHAVTACVWENDATAADGQTFKVHNVSVESRYRDQTGEWKSGKSFRGSQLHVLLYCLQKCADFIFAARDPNHD